MSCFLNCLTKARSVRVLCALASFSTDATILNAELDPETTDEKPSPKPPGPANKSTILIGLFIQNYSDCNKMMLPGFNPFSRLNFFEKII
jgi:hypothetical protein